MCCSTFDLTVSHSLGRFRASVAGSCWCRCVTSPPPIDWPWSSSRRATCPRWTSPDSQVGEPREALFISIFNYSFYLFLGGGGWYTYIALFHEEFICCLTRKWLHGTHIINLSIYLFISFYQMFIFIYFNLQLFISLFFDLGRGLWYTYIPLFHEALIYCYSRKW